MLVLQQISLPITQLAIEDMESQGIESHAGKVTDILVDDLFVRGSDGLQVRIVVPEGCIVIHAEQRHFPLRVLPTQDTVGIHAR